jgi:hypothetical protein
MFTSRWSRLWAACALAVFLCSGCFGYNRSAKRTAYVGDSLLIVGGGGTIAAELLLGGGEEACQGPGCPADLGPITGPLVAGTMLVTAGIVGILLNITRPIVRTSR